MMAIEKVLMRLIFAYREPQAHVDRSPPSRLAVQQMLNSNPQSVTVFK
jgi:hypothetical protein